MLLSEAIEGFLYSKAVTSSPHTISDYRNTLRQWLEYIDDQPVNMVTSNDVHRFLYFLKVERKLKPKTVRNAHTGISAFYTWAEQELGIEHVIRGKVAAPKANQPEIVPLSKRDVRDLLMAMDRTDVWETGRRRPARSQRPTRLRDKAIVLVLLDTGIRAQELCDLRIEDVDLQAGAVQVRAGKGDKGRTVYLGHVAKEALWRYLSKRPDKRSDEPLFMTSRRGPMDRSALRRMLASAGQRAEIPETVGPHRFRHTFAINYLRNGGDIFTLQRLLGHSSMEMVRRYLAIAEVDIAEAHRRASPADNWRLG